MTTPPKQQPAPDTGHAEHAGALAGATRAFGSVTILSRFGGLIRDVLLVRVFGATAIGSAFAAAFAIPNMFRRLFGEGALSAAFIPEYAQAVKHDPAMAGRLASFTLRRLALTTSLVTVAVQVVLGAVLLLAPRDTERSLSLGLIITMLPFMPLVCCGAILAGMLQVHGRFGASAGGALLLNAFIIAVGLYSVLTGSLGGETTAYILGAATVLSGVSQCIWFARLLRPHVRWSRDTAGTDAAAVRMLRKFVPVAIGMGTLQINALIDTLIAMWPIWVGPLMFGIVCPLDDASNSILSFTQRLYQFPLGVFGIAVASAAFPLLARHADDPPAFAAMLRRGLRLSLFIGLPASFGLALVRDDLTYVMFAGGSGGGAASGFGDQVGRSALVLLGYAPGIWAYSLNHVYTRAFYARGDTSTPVKVAIAAMALNFVLNLSLIWSLREAGMAFATSIAAMVQCAALALIAERRFGNPGGGILDVFTLSAMSRTLLASTVMAGCVAALLVLWPTPSRWAIHAARLCTAGAVGGLAYLIAARLVRIEELGLVFRRGPARDASSTSTPR